MSKSCPTPIATNCELSIVSAQMQKGNAANLGRMKAMLKKMRDNTNNRFNSPIPKSKAAARALKTENDRLRAALLALYVVASKYAVVPDAEYCAITNAATLTESA